VKIILHCDDNSFADMVSMSKAAFIAIKDGHMEKKGSLIGFDFDGNYYSVYRNKDSVTVRPA